MLDKSLPYVGIFMKRPAGTPFVEFPLPDGFRYVLYQPDDEVCWARIETSVLEFDSEFDAVSYFSRKFKPETEELQKRLLFIESDNGKKIATANAWWHHVNNKRRAWLHWVAVDPEFQGLGLGKAITSESTRIMLELEGDVDIYLSTQTWSHKAIRIYQKFGYEPTDEKILYKGNKDSNYKKAMKILNSIVTANNTR